MIKRLAMLCLVAMFSVALASPSARAQDDAAKAAFAAELTRGSLRDINTVLVLVEDFSNGAKVLSLSKDSIQTDVELKLRLAGMHVATLEEWSEVPSKDVPGQTGLDVSVILTDDAKAAFIEVSLYQNVVLSRNGQVVLGATTWRKGILRTIPTAQVIRDIVKDIVDQFLNDWLAVNPKK